MMLIYTLHYISNLPLTMDANPSHLSKLVLSGHVSEDKQLMTAEIKGSCPASTVNVDVLWFKWFYD